MTPENGVKAFLKRFGGMSHVVSAANSMGFRLNLPTLRKWVRQNEMPEHYYQALSTLVTRDETQIAKGFVEIYFKGKPLGKLYLTKDITMIIRKKRT